MTLPVNTLNIIRRTQRYDAVYGFYVDTLGLTVLALSTRPGQRSVMLSLGENIASATVEIIEMEDRLLPDTAPLYIQFGIVVENATQWHARLNAAGVTIARGLEDDAFGIRSFAIDDPDDIRIWFRQYMD